VSDIAPSVAEALKMNERCGFDAAILDCVQKDGRCEPIAKALDANGPLHQRLGALSRGSRPVRPQRAMRIEVFDTD